ncbi:MAG: radical SAM domain-containing protein [Candidatus Magnetoglobus multicellularis str. Araruama]|uniref:Radical SAM domain-containing protein n=1 Tax=Candidatus Magnetoglobus multicellularis str. Araruama TaxID=890399 RepID=A0A1V1P5U4_9BACT|nr:MAG: radical SAM domain-containing protein [Candidatus Magnetoglobus multicellularis str. Araruama]
MKHILPHVEKPGRYIGAEANIVKKDHQKIPCKIALAFPDMYEIGTSHMGIQVLYNIINQHANALAERVFAPAPDMARHLKQQSIKLSSLETQTPLEKFDIIGFSLLYELNYTNILSILDLSRIPFYASDRDDHVPLIIAGGPCTCNPEPISDFFDALVVGDGEQVIIQMIETWLDHNKQNKDNLLRAWQKIEGVYIPRFYESDPHTGIGPSCIETPATIRRAIAGNLDEICFPDHPVVAIGKPVHDRYSLEIARGCTRGCRFCQAGMIYRPVRERSVNHLLELAAAALKSTGYDEISLLSLSSGDYSHINSLMSHIMSYCHQEKIAVSLPSLRAGTLTPELMALIKQVRKTGFTIAPEAGSSRLRNVINKNISEEQIISTVSSAFDMGWQLIKLYFMIGLPTETHDDREEMIDLVKRLKGIIKKYSRRAHLNVSVSTFIPKPHTPFQWCNQISLETSKDIIGYLQEQFNTKGIRFKWQDPSVSFIEGIWSRGDRRLSSVLVEAYGLGCQFDGWSDRFRFDLWQTAFDRAEISQNDYLASRSFDDPLPWNYIDVRVKDSFLMDEWHKALNEGHTGDCRTDACNNCGCCDFNEIKPMVGQDIQAAPVSPVSSIQDSMFQKMLFTYTKKEYARFLGHLEMVTVIIRAFSRAGYQFQYSQGFHPMPKVSFGDPLPLGMASEAEHFAASIVDTQKKGHKVDQDCLKRVNAELPEGLRLVACEIVNVKNPLIAKKPAQIKYRIQLPVDINSQRIDDFMLSKTHMVIRQNKKGKHSKIDLKEKIIHIQLTGRQLFCVIDNHPPTIRPGLVLESILFMNDTEIRSAEIIKETD